MHTLTTQAEENTKSQSFNAQGVAMSAKGSFGPGPIRRRLARLLQAYGRAAALTPHR